ncbi:MAG: hypothetical protein HYV76_00690 [Candidatus Vogelbacteria bacterium]|nr:hypothetical protein [Candidatus Vogelbacteria bacterium]
MSTPIDRRTPEGLRQFLEVQKREALGPENRWFAGIALQHPPSDNEAVMHFIRNGGATDFANRFENNQEFSI